jgi:predicted SprT family Zn-dependent metalloprotease
MTPDMVPHVAQRLLELHGLWQAGWRFTLDSAVRRAGVCRYRRKVVSLSRHYVELNLKERENDVIDTILHEIAHAIAGSGHGHDDHWKDCCLIVGAKPVRCYDAGVVVMPKEKWAATCDGCGHIYRRHRKLKLGRSLYCTKCGPDIGRLTYVDTTVLPSPTGATTSSFPTTLR